MIRQNKILQLLMKIFKQFIDLGNRSTCHRSSRFPTFLDWVSVSLTDLMALVPSFYTMEFGTSPYFCFLWFHGTMSICPLHHVWWLPFQLKSAHQYCDATVPWFHGAMVSWCIWPSGGSLDTQEVTPDPQEVTPDPHSWPSGSHSWQW